MLWIWQLITGIKSVIKYIDYSQLTPVNRPLFNYITWHSWTEGRLQGSIGTYRHPQQLTPPRAGASIGKRTYIIWGKSATVCRLQLAPAAALFFTGCIALQTTMNSIISFFKRYKVQTCHACGMSTDCKLLQPARQCRRPMRHCARL